MAEKNISTIDHIPASERGKGFPPFAKDTFASQLVWLAIFFIALYVLTAKLIQPRLGGILAARGKRIADDLAEAADHKKQSDAALTAYEQGLADARNRAQSVANETRERLNAESEKARHALEAKLNIKLVDAEKTIAATKTAAMANVRDIAIVNARAIVDRLIPPPNQKPKDEEISTALKAAAIVELLLENAEQSAAYGNQVTRVFVDRLTPSAVTVKAVEDAVDVARNVVEQLSGSAPSKKALAGARLAARVVVARLAEPPASDPIVTTAVDEVLKR